MSFTSEIKQEIAFNKLKDCCQRAQLSALLQLTSSIGFADRQFMIVIRSENPTTAKRIVSLIKSLYAVDTDLTITKKTNLKKNNVYRIKVKEKAKDILIHLGIYSENRGILSHPTYDVVSKEHCARAYIAGAFLASGTCNTPTSSNYHFEIAVNDLDYAGFIAKLLSRFNIEAKISKRRNKYVIYIKKAENIADLLKLIGANECCMKFENIRIDRDFVVSNKRVENCLIANEMKKLEACDRQLEILEKIEESGYKDKLDEKSRMIYDLRKEFPDISLSELCEKYKKRYGLVISKSGIKHRLNKLENIANSLINKEEDN